MKKSALLKIFFVWAFVSLVLIDSQAFAAIIRVKPDGNDVNSGASWALAKKTVQAAVDAANEGDEIWVAAGAYPEHIKNKVLNEAVDPVPINVALYGGFVGTETARAERDWKVNLAVLDGGGGEYPSPPEVGSVVYISGGAGRATRVDGFVITNGHAIGGGGILIEGSGPTIANNTIWQNRAGIGGGIGISNYDFVPPTISQPVITDNKIFDNSAGEGGGGIAVIGAARLVSYDPAAPIISRNIISQNTSSDDGGGIGCYGHTAAVISDNFIVANAAADSENNFAGGGGGIFATSRDLDDEPISYAVCAPVIISNAICANGGYLGAGIYCWDTDVEHGGIPVITNNTVMSNNGIGIYWKETSPVMTNNLVAFNPWGLQQPADAPTSPTISHNCVYGNSIRGERTDYNGIADQTGLNGNISIDPFLANTRIGDIRLQPGSACIGAGSSAAVSPDWKDLQGEDRIQGNGVDIGADESDGTSWTIPTPVIHVRADGSDSEDGTTWAKAKKTVAAGLTAAFLGGGAEVWVAEGTYTERNSLQAFIYLYGGFAGTEASRSQRDIAANPTILDGDGIPNVLRVSKAGYLVSAIDGFTIQNGGAYTNSVLPGGNDGYGGRGGGIYCHMSSPSIENNIITHNSLGNPFDGNKLGLGAGIYAYSSFALIKGNTITENECINTFDGSGAGIYFHFSMPTIEENTFTQNHAVYGSAIYGTLSIPRIVRNLIENNVMYHNAPSVYDGSTYGAVTLWLGEDFLIEGNTIRGNIASIGAGIHIGMNSKGRIQNNLIIGNVAYDYSGAGNGGMGGGIYASISPTAADNVHILNNTIVGNTATLKLLPPPMNEEGGGLALSLPSSLPPPPDPPPAKLVMANNIIAFNSSGVWGYPTSPMLVPTLVKNDVYGSTGGTNCNYINLSAGATDISQDPSFVNLSSGDLHLLTTSLCKEAAENGQVPTALTTDFDGNPRIIDGDSDGSAVVDTGAYEFTSGTDATDPAVTITMPTTSAAYVTSLAVIDLGGTASDNVGITGVTWSNDRGGSGTCVGTASWNADGILLYLGQNIITVTAHDHSPGGNQGSDVITVTYSLPLTISGYVKTSGGSGIGGVVMGGLPSGPTTDDGGYYSDAAIPFGWFGTVTPSKSGLSFSPPFRAYDNVTSDQTNQAYTASGGLAQPAVTTAAATSVRSTSAVSGGDIVSDGGAAVTARGVCWDLAPNPTISSSHTDDGAGTGSFTSNPAGLMAGMTYYVRAYAANSVGTSYGNEVSFTTQTQDYAVPFHESFDSPARPADWTVRVEGDGVEDQWIVGLSVSAGGMANEMRGRYQFAPGTMRLVTPPIDTSGCQALALSFRHFLASWDVGGIALRIQTSPDGVIWTDEAWTVSTSSADIGPAMVRTILSHNLNRKTTYVAFSMEGDLFYFEDWFIDDVSIRPKDDFVGAWDGQGVYYRNSDTSAWVKLASPATMIAAGDLDGDGIDDLIGLWPTQGGIWVKYSKTGTWARLSSTAVHIAAGDMDGDGRVDLLGTWDGQGVYYRDSLSGAWVKLASPATLITAGDLDGDGTDDLVGIWPGQGGVWVKYSQTGAWARLSSTARDIAAGDMNGDGRDDLLATWDGQGVYYRDSVNGGWVKMASQADQITCGDLDADGAADLIGIWGTQGGVWAKYSRTSVWALLGSTARDISAGKMRPAPVPAPEAAEGGVTAPPEAGEMQAAAADGAATKAAIELPLPLGGTEEGPGIALNKRDISDKGPGGARFVYLEEKNLVPREDRTAELSRIPSPGEPGFVAQEQKNVHPGAVLEQDRREAAKRKVKK